MGIPDIRSIVAGAYNAALDGNLWESWFLELTRTLGGSSSLFALFDSKKVSFERSIVLDVPSRAADEYLAGQHLNDPQLNVASSLDGSGVYLGMPGIDRDDARVAEYLRWERSVVNIAHSQTAVITFGSTAIRAAMSIHRSPALGHTTYDDHRALRSLLPELARAFQLGFRQGEMLQNAFWDGTLIGDAKQLAFLLDERGKIIRCTDQASRLISKNDGISIKSGTLMPSSMGEASVLGKIIAEAVQAVHPKSGAMRITRPSGKRPLIFICYPLQRTMRSLAPRESAALVTIIEQGISSSPPTELYQEAFGLTVREAEFACAFISGHSPETAATVMAISIPTARTHIRRIFEKTGAANLVDLTRLLSRII